MHIIVFGYFLQVAIVKFTKQLYAHFEFSVLLCLLVMLQVYLFSSIGRRVWDGQGLFSASGYSAAALSPFDNCSKLTGFSRYFGQYSRVRAYFVVLDRAFLILF